MTPEEQLKYEELTMEVLGIHGKTYMPIMNRVLLNLPKVTYFFMDINQYILIKIQDPVLANYIYWFEIFERAQIGCNISIIRTLKWLEGMLIAYEKDNLFLFSTSYRGFIESATDIYDGLFKFPLIVSENFLIIKSILERKTEKIVESKETEDSLIHFMNARRPKKGEQIIDTHRAKPATHYIRLLENFANPNSSEIIDCYSYLCELTHPSSTSVNVYLKDVPTGLEIELSSDKTMIKDILGKYNILSTLFELSLNPVFMTIKLINLLPIDILQNIEGDNVNMDNIPAWLKIIEKIKKDT